MFIFVTNCPTVLQSGCTVLHSYHRAPVASHGYQLWCPQCLHFSPPNRYIVISPCFNLQLSSDLWCWRSCYRLIEPEFIFGVFSWFLSLLLFHGVFFAAQSSPSCSEQGLLFRRGVLASPCRGFSCCRPRALEPRPGSYGAWASLLRGMWDLPGSGIRPMSPALEGRFSTTWPPGKSWVFAFILLGFNCFMPILDGIPLLDKCFESIFQGWMGPRDPPFQFPTLKHSNKFALFIPDQSLGENYTEIFDE